MGEMWREMTKIVPKATMHSVVERLWKTNAWEKESWFLSSFSALNEKPRPPTLKGSSTCSSVICSAGAVNCQRIEFITENKTDFHAGFLFAKKVIHVAMIQETLFFFAFFCSAATPQEDDRSKMAVAFLALSKPTLLHVNLLRCCN